MNTVKKIGTWVHSLIVIVLMLTATVVIISALGLPGGYRLFTVMSGSMEPALHTGSIVITVPMSAYQTGDVITFSTQEEFNQHPMSTVTHRIIAAQTTELGTFFQTKGDANDGIDSQLVAREQVMGRVLLTAPLLGYFIYFVKTLPGFILFVILPAVGFILYQLWNVLKILKDMRLTKKAKDYRNVVPVLSLGYLLSAAAYFSVLDTNAYYVDTAAISTNGLPVKNEEPEVSVRVDSTQHMLSFQLKNIKSFARYEYKLIYETDTELQGAVGSGGLTGASEFTKSDILLGTCSEHGCTYHQQLHDFELLVRLTTGDGQVVTLQKTW